MKTKKEAALGFIFVTMLIDVIGFGIIIPVIPKLIQQLESCTVSEAARYGGWLMVAYSVMQFVFAPVLGNLSDRYGRRPILLFSLLGFGIDYMLTGFSPNIEWLFAGRIIAGITGASFSTASAYIADVSTPEKKAQNFGMVGVAFGLGFIIGPVLGGYLGKLGPRVPFFAAAALALLNALYGFLLLPESLARENRRAFSWQRANPVGAFKQLGKYPAIAALATSITLLYVAGFAMQSTWTFFAIEKFGWTEAMVGNSLGFVGLLVGIVQGGLIRVVHPILGQQRSVVVGLLLYTLGFTLFGFASQSWMLYAFMIPYALGGISGPALQGIISNHVPATEQGELQGALTGLMSGSAIIGPMLMTNVFAWFTSPGAPVQLPGAPFLLGGLLTLIATLLAVRSFKKDKSFTFAGK
ncbi:TCR/Tet family MFS transporter [Filimonas effusa]|uniref:MFS transporter n=1 Tax=Filimonas effusa TaxID=2508721 RepID=A0A4Q1DAQ6_9BACT|nr:TCR/Tet family MFS transporter [Filimonas effusa]RXK86487.1 MFS transporter [Filimonas effusa]